MKRENIKGLGGTFFLHFTKDRGQMRLISNLMITFGLILSLLDMSLITLYCKGPLPRGTGIILPIGIGLAFTGGLMRERK